MKKSELVGLIRETIKEQMMGQDTKKITMQLKRRFLRDKASSQIAVIAASFVNDIINVVDNIETKSSNERVQMLQLLKRLRSIWDKRELQ